MTIDLHVLGTQVIVNYVGIYPIFFSIQWSLKYIQSVKA